jgi:hypothetical protein
MRRLSGYYCKKLISTASRACFTCWVGQLGGSKPHPRLVGCRSRGVPERDLETPPNFAMAALRITYQAALNNTFVAERGAVRTSRRILQSGGCGTLHGTFCVFGHIPCRRHVYIRSGFAGDVPSVVVRSNRERRKI